MINRMPGNEFKTPAGAGFCDQPPPKRRRRSSASSNVNASINPPTSGSDLFPPPLTGSGDTVIASNPFDDTPVKQPVPPVMNVNSRHKNLPNNGHLSPGIPLPTPPFANNPYPNGGVNVNYNNININSGNTNNLPIARAAAGARSIITYGIPAAGMCSSPMDSGSTNIMSYTPARPQHPVHPRQQHNPNLRLHNSHPVQPQLQPQPQHARSQPQPVVVDGTTLVMRGAENMRHCGRMMNSSSNNSHPYSDIGRPMQQQPSSPSVSTDSMHTNHYNNYPMSSYSPHQKHHGSSSSPSLILNSDDQNVNGNNIATVANNAVGSPEVAVVNELLGLPNVADMNIKPYNSNTVNRRCSSINSNSSNSSYNNINNGNSNIFYSNNLSETTEITRFNNSNNGNNSSSSGSNSNSNSSSSISGSSNRGRSVPNSPGAVSFNNSNNGRFVDNVNNQRPLTTTALECTSKNALTCQQSFDDINSINNNMQQQCGMMPPPPPSAANPPSSAIGSYYNSAPPQTVYNDVMNGSPDIYYTQEQGYHPAISNSNSNCRAKSTCSNTSVRRYNVRPHLPSYNALDEQHQNIHCSANVTTECATSNRVTCPYNNYNGSNNNGDNFNRQLQSLNTSVPNISQWSASSTVPTTFTHCSIKNEAFSGNSGRNMCLMKEFTPGINSNNNSNNNNNNNNSNNNNSSSSSSSSINSNSNNNNSNNSSAMFPSVSNSSSNSSTCDLNVSNVNFIDRRSVPLKAYNNTSPYDMFAVQSNGIVSDPSQQQQLIDYQQQPATVNIADSKSKNYENSKNNDINHQKFTNNYQNIIMPAGKECNNSTCTIGVVTKDGLDQQRQSANNVIFSSAANCRISNHFKHNDYIDLPASMLTNTVSNNSSAPPMLNNSIIGTEKVAINNNNNNNKLGTDANVNDVSISATGKTKKTTGIISGNCCNASNSDTNDPIIITDDDDDDELAIKNNVPGNKAENDNSQDSLLTITGNVGFYDSDDDDDHGVNVAALSSVLNSTDAESTTRTITDLTNVASDGNDAKNCYSIINDNNYVSSGEVYTNNNQNNKNNNSSNREVKTDPTSLYNKPNTEAIDLDAIITTNDSSNSKTTDAIVDNLLLKSTGKDISNTNALTATTTATITTTTTTTATTTITTVSIITTTTITTTTTATIANNNSNNNNDIIKETDCGKNIVVKSAKCDDGDKKKINEISHKEQPDVINSRNDLMQQQFGYTAKNNSHNEDINSVSKSATDNGNNTNNCSNLNNNNNNNSSGYVNSEKTIANTLASSINIDNNATGNSSIIEHKIGERSSNNSSSSDNDNITDIFGACGFSDSGTGALTINAINDRDNNLSKYNTPSVSLYDTVNDNSSDELSSFNCITGSQKNSACNSLIDIDDEITVKNKNESSDCATTRNDDIYDSSLMNTFLTDDQSDDFYSACKFSPTVSPTLCGGSVTTTKSDVTNYTNDETGCAGIQTPVHVPAYNSSTNAEAGRRPVSSRVNSSDTANKQEISYHCNNSANNHHGKHDGIRKQITVRNTSDAVTDDAIDKLFPSVVVDDGRHFFNGTSVGVVANTVSVTGAGKDNDDSGSASTAIGCLKDNFSNFSAEKFNSVSCGAGNNSRFINSGSDSRTDAARTGDLNNKHKANAGHDVVVAAANIRVEVGKNFDFTSITSNKNQTSCVTTGFVDNANGADCILKENTVLDNSDCSPANNSYLLHSSSSPCNSNSGATVTSTQPPIKSPTISPPLAVSSKQTDLESVAPNPADPNFKATDKSNGDKKDKKHPVFPCGLCHKEVTETEEAIFCESGCFFWFHRECTGLTEAAYEMLLAELYAEWVCEKCLRSKHVPLIKFKS